MSQDGGGPPSYSNLTYVTIAEEEEEEEEEQQQHDLCQNEEQKVSEIIVAKRSDADDDEEVVQAPPVPERRLMFLRNTRQSKQQQSGGGSSESNESSSLGMTTDSMTNSSTTPDYNLKHRAAAAAAAAGKGTSSTTSESNSLELTKDSGRIRDDTKDTLRPPESSWMPVMSPRSNRDVPEIQVQTWDDRRRSLGKGSGGGAKGVKKLDLDEMDRPGTFARGSSLRTAVREKKRSSVFGVASSGSRSLSSVPSFAKRAGTNNKTEADAAVPTPTTTTSSSSPRSPPSSLSSLSLSRSPSLMSTSSRNYPRAVDLLPPGCPVRPEELRLNLDSLRRSDSDATRSTVSDLRSLDHQGMLE